MEADFKESVFRIGNETDFANCALEVFRFQAENNRVYREYLSLLGVRAETVKSIEEIPFLPIEFFRNHQVISDNRPVQKVFESSGTAGTTTSRHYVSDLDLYEKSFTLAFKLFYGDPQEYFFAMLLPSYLERENSSLVYMADHLIRNSSDKRSSFYLDDHEKLLATLEEICAEKKKGILLGVSFALLDLAEKYSPDLGGITIVETGGMKGRRKEITREELHATLKTRFRTCAVHSEYGMTELLSQAWSKGEGIFRTPPWMRIRLREINDPLSVFDEPGITGGINIIDLANCNSCSFIATGDLGRLLPGGSFEVLGRFSASDLRGCNLLVD